MFRLTLLLLAGIGVAMVIGGRDLTQQEVAQLAAKPQEPKPAPEVTRAASAPVELAAAHPAAVPPAPAPVPASVTPAADTVDPAAVRNAVELALATDKLDMGLTPDAAPSAPVALASAPAETSVAPDDAGAETPDAMTADDPAPDEALGAAQVWYVNGTSVNVRSGPSTQFAVVDQLYFGEATEVLSDPGKSWVKIRIQGDGVEGYISRQFLQNADPNG